MKKLIALFTLGLACFAATAQAPVLTPTGTSSSGNVYNVDVQLFPLSDGSYSHVFELCYMNPGSTVANKIQPCNFVPDPLGFSGTFTSSAWSYGIQSGAQVWVNQYNVPNPYRMGSYFWTQYYAAANDSANWVQSNVVTVQVPGSASSPARFSPGKKNK